MKIRIIYIIFVGNRVGCWWNGVSIALEIDGIFFGLSVNDKVYSVDMYSV